MNKLRELLATCFYVGYIPGVPGTWGSLLAFGVFLIAGRPIRNTGWVVFLGLVFVSIFALFRTKQVFGDNDPRPVVLDEFAGMWLTFLVGASTSLILLCLGFAAFRAFDAVKPFPICRIEKVPGWRGVLADDLAAGLAAGIIVRLAGLFVYA